MCIYKIYGHIYIVVVISIDSYTLRNSYTTRYRCFVLYIVCIVKCKVYIVYRFLFVNAHVSIGALYML